MVSWDGSEMCLNGECNIWDVLVSNFIISHYVEIGL